MPRDGQLRTHLETADGIDLVAVEFDTVRRVVGKRKHVDDAAAQRILAGLRHEIDPFEPVFFQKVDEEILRYRLTLVQLHRMRRQTARRNDFLGQGLRIGHNPQRRARLVVGLPQAVQHLGARQHVGVINLIRFVGFLIGGGKIQNPFLRLLQAALPRQFFQVVAEIGGLFPVGQDEQLRFFQLRGRGCGDDRLGGTEQVAQRDFACLTR